MQEVLEGMEDRYDSKLLTTGAEGTKSPGSSCEPMLSDRSVSDPMCQALHVVLQLLAGVLKVILERWRSFLKLQ